MALTHVLCCLVVYIPKTLVGCTLNEALRGGIKMKANEDGIALPRLFVLSLWHYSGLWLAGGIELYREKDIQ